VVLAAAQGYPRTIVIDSTNVYWSNGNPGAVSEIAKDGTGFTPLASNIDTSIDGLAVGGGSIYWSEFSLNSVMSLELGLDGGVPVTLVPNTVANLPLGIALDSSYLYWLDTGSGQVLASPLDGVGGVKAIASGGEAFLTAIAIDSTTVYWTETLPGGLFKTAIVGGDRVFTVASTVGDRFFDNGVAVDATNIYWADATAGTVMAVAVGGGPAMTLASGQPGAGAIATDCPIPPGGCTTTGVYWANYAAPGSVMKVVLAGGGVTTLASGQSNPIGIAADVTSVYWVNEGTGMCDGGLCGSVMKVANPP
jgi:hypothetical protein